ncbi:MAG: hypothetical protein ACQKBV_11780 [Puniceicoccales bacterium]
MPLAAQMPGKDILERTSRDGIFRVVGTDFGALQTVGAMTDQMERLGLRYFPEMRELTEPIQVTLLPSPDFSENYRINFQPNGNYFVYIPWNGDTRFGDVCQALASAYIRRTAVWRYGREAGAKAPDWLELAFGQLLEATIRPGYADTQGDEALIRPPLGLMELLEAEGPFDLEQRRVALNAVWFFRLMENRITDRKLFRKVLAAFLQDLNPSYILVKAFPNRFESEQDMEMWWAVGFQAMARGRETPFITMEQARETVRSLAILTVDIDGADRRLAGPVLWELRARDNVRSALELRQREIKLELQRVNPVYYNAVLSLGLFIDSALNAESLAVVERANQAFLSDFRDAQQLELEIKRLLRW